MTTRKLRRIVLWPALATFCLAVSGCYYGPPPRYASPAWSYPRYAYRPVPHYGGGYGFGGGYGYGQHPYWR